MGLRIRGGRRGNVDQSSSLSQYINFRGRGIAVANRSVNSSETLHISKGKVSNIYPNSDAVERRKRNDALNQSILKNFNHLRSVTEEEKLSQDVHLELEKAMNIFDEDKFSSASSDDDSLNEICTLEKDKRNEPDVTLNGASDQVICSLLNSSESINEMSEMLKDSALETLKSSSKGNVQKNKVNHKNILTGVNISPKRIEPILFYSKNCQNSSSINQPPNGTLVHPERTNKACNIKRQGLSRGRMGKIGQQKSYKYFNKLTKRNRLNFYKITSDRNPKFSTFTQSLGVNHKKTQKALTNGKGGRMGRQFQQNSPKKYLHSSVNFTTKFTMEVDFQSFPGTSAGNQVITSGDMSTLPMILRNSVMAQNSDSEKDDDEDIMENDSTRYKNGGNEVIDIIDGIEFVTFENEHDMVQFTRLASDEYGRGDLTDMAFSSEFPEAIIPKKTKDIKKIKGWQKKKFTVTQNPIVDLNSTGMELTDVSDPCSDTIEVEHNYMRRELGNDVNFREIEDKPPSSIESNDHLILGEHDDIRKLQDVNAESHKESKMPEWKPSEKSAFVSFVNPVTENSRLENNKYMSSQVCVKPCKNATEDFSKTKIDESSLQTSKSDQVSTKSWEKLRSAIMSKMERVRIKRKVIKADKSFQIDLPGEGVRGFIGKKLDEETELLDWSHSFENMWHIDKKRAFFAATAVVLPRSLRKSLVLSSLMVPCDGIASLSKHQKPLDSATKKQQAPIQRRLLRSSMKKSVPVRLTRASINSSQARLPLSPTPSPMPKPVSLRKSFPTPASHPIPHSCIIPSSENCSNVSSSTSVINLVDTTPPLLENHQLKSSHTSASSLLRSSSLSSDEVSQSCCQDSKQISFKNLPESKSGSQVSDKANLHRGVPIRRMSRKSRRKMLSRQIWIVRRNRKLNESGKGDASQKTISETPGPNKCDSLLKGTTIVSTVGKSDKFKATESRNYVVKKPNEESSKEGTVVRCFEINKKAVDQDESKNTKVTKADMTISKRKESEVENIVENISEVSSPVPWEENGRKGFQEKGLSPEPENEELRVFLKPKPRIQLDALSPEKNGRDNLMFLTSPNIEASHQLEFSPPKSTDVEVFKSNSPRSPALARKKLIRELQKLNANFVSVDQDENDKIKVNCPKEFCRLGCVCDSINTDKRLIEHCGKLECMFSCTCPSTDGVSNATKHPIIGSETVTRLQEESSRHMAKIERYFHNTVVEAAGELVLPGRGQRERRLPKRFLDESVVPEVLFFPKKPKTGVLMSKVAQDHLPIAKKVGIRPQSRPMCKQSFVLLHRLPDFQASVRCAFHSKFNCPCLTFCSPGRKARNVAIKSTTHGRKGYMRESSVESSEVSVDSLVMDETPLATECQNKVQNSEQPSHSLGSTVENFGLGVISDVQSIRPKEIVVDMREFKVTTLDDQKALGEKELFVDVQVGPRKEDTLSIRSGEECLNENISSTLVNTDDEYLHCARTAGIDLWISQHYLDSEMPKTVQHEDISQAPEEDHAISGDLSDLVKQDDSTPLFKIIEVKSLPPSSFEIGADSADEIDTNKLSDRIQKSFANYESFDSWLRSHETRCKDLEQLCSKSLQPLKVNSVIVMRWSYLDKLLKSHLAHMWIRQRFGLNARIFVTLKDIPPDSACVNFHDLEKEEELTAKVAIILRSAKNDLSSRQGYCILICKGGYWQAAGNINLRGGNNSDGPVKTSKKEHTEGNGSPTANLKVKTGQANVTDNDGHGVFDLFGKKLHHSPSKTSHFGGVNLKNSNSVVLLSPDVNLPTFGSTEGMHNPAADVSESSDFSESAIRLALSHDVPVTSVMESHGINTKSLSTFELDIFDSELGKLNQSGGSSAQSFATTESILLTRKKDSFPLFTNIRSGAAESSCLPIVKDLTFNLERVPGNLEAAFIANKLTNIKAGSGSHLPHSTDSSKSKCFNENTAHISAPKPLSSTSMTSEVIQHEAFTQSLESPLQILQAEEKGTMSAMPCQQDLNSSATDESKRTEKKSPQPHISEKRSEPLSNKATLNPKRATEQPLVILETERNIVKSESFKLSSDAVWSGPPAPSKSSGSAPQAANPPLLIIDLKSLLPGQRVASNNKSVAFRITNVTTLPKGLHDPKTKVERFSDKISSVTGINHTSQTKGTSLCTVVDTNQEKELAQEKIVISSKLPAPYSTVSGPVAMKTPAVNHAFEAEEAKAIHVDIIKEVNPAICRNKKRLSYDGIKSLKVTEGTAEIIHTTLISEDKESEGIETGVPNVMSVSKPRPIFTANAQDHRNSSHSHNELYCMHSQPFSSKVLPDKLNAEDQLSGNGEVLATKSNDKLKAASSSVEVPPEGMSCEQLTMDTEVNINILVNGNRLEGMPLTMSTLKDTVQEILPKSTTEGVQEDKRINGPTDISGAEEEEPLSEISILKVIKRKGNREVEEIPVKKSSKVNCYNDVGNVVVEGHQIEETGKLAINQVCGVISPKIGEEDGRRISKALVSGIMEKSPVTKVSPSTDNPTVIHTPTDVADNMVEVSAGGPEQSEIQHSIDKNMKETENKPPNITTKKVDTNDGTVCASGISSMLEVTHVSKKVEDSTGSKVDAPVQKDEILSIVSAESESKNSERHSLDVEKEKFNPSEEVVVDTKSQTPCKESSFQDSSEEVVVETKSQTPSKESSFQDSSVAKTPVVIKTSSSCMPSPLTPTSIETSAASHICEGDNSSPSSSSSSVITVIHSSKQTNESSTENDVIWYHLDLNDKFDKLTVEETGFSTSLSRLLSAVKLATSSNRTVRLAFDKKGSGQEMQQFKKGIYAVPTVCGTYVRIGPYKPNEPTGVKMLKKMGNHQYKVIPNLLKVEVDTPATNEILNLGAGKSGRENNESRDCATESKSKENDDDGKTQGKINLGDENIGISTALELNRASKEYKSAGEVNVNAKSSITIVKTPVKACYGQPTEILRASLLKLSSVKGCKNPAIVAQERPAEDVCTKNMNAKSPSGAHVPNTVGSFTGSCKSITSLDKECCTSVDGSRILPVGCDGRIHATKNCSGSKKPSEHKALTVHSSSLDEKISPNKLLNNGGCVSKATLDDNESLIRENEKHLGPMPTVHRDEGSRFAVNENDVLGNLNRLSDVPTGNQTKHSKELCTNKDNANEMMVLDEKTPVPTAVETLDSNKNSGIEGRQLNVAKKSTPVNSSVIEKTVKKPGSQETTQVPLVANASENPNICKSSEKKKDICLKFETLAEHNMKSEKIFECGYLIPDIPKLAPVAAKRCLKPEDVPAIAIESPTNPGVFMKFRNIESINKYISIVLHKNIRFFPSDLEIEWTFFKHKPAASAPGLLDLKHISSDMFITRKGVFKYANYSKIDSTQNIWLRKEEGHQPVKDKLTEEVEEAKVQLLSLLVPQSKISIVNCEKAAKKALAEIGILQNHNELLCQSNIVEKRKKLKLEEKLRALLKAHGVDTFSEFIEKSKTHLREVAEKDNNKQKDPGQNRQILKAKTMSSERHCGRGGKILHKSRNSASITTDESDDNNENIGSAEGMAYGTRSVNMNGRILRSSGVRKVPQRAEDQKSESISPISNSPKSPNKSSPVKKTVPHKIMSASPNSVRKLISTCFDSNVATQSECSGSETASSSVISGSFTGTNEQVSSTGGQIPQNSDEMRPVSVLLWRSSFSKLKNDTEKRDLSLASRDSIPNSKKNLLKKKLNLKQRGTVKGIGASTSGVHKLLKGFPSKNPKR